MESEKRQCQKCKSEFTLDSDDFGFYKKMSVPPPKICPDCRFKMKAVWRNEMSLYSGRKCGMCGKNILSMYNPKSLYNTFCHECFFSDSWNPKDFAQDYIKDKPFFEQLNDLFHKVPKSTTFISSGDRPSVNSEYANMAGGMKNCYLVFNGGIGEELMYCRGVRNARETNDSYFAEFVERCYESINIFKSNGLIFSRNTADSMDSVFILNCSGLNNCFGCVNLKNKSYHFFNEPLSREEYLKRIGDIMGSYSKMLEFQKQFDEFSLKFPRRENNNLKTVNSVGDFLFECKNTKNSFEAMGTENSNNIFSARYSCNSNGVIGYGFKSELLLECVAVGYSSMIIGSHSSSNCQNVFYSFALRNCHDCFGCDGLKNVSYCILNKQYSKEEYEKLAEYITNELKEKELFGLMIPPELAPFAYNETIAQDNMSLTKEEALAQGFRWEDDVQKTEGKETLLPENIPDHIKDVPDFITKEILKCTGCGRNYKITEQELVFYGRMVLPIPRKCFYCRHRDRVIRRGPYKFWNRNCAKCQKDIVTNYAPDRPETVYCEKCYQQEVY